MARRLKLIADLTGVLCGLGVSTRGWGLPGTRDNSHFPWSDVRNRVFLPSYGTLMCGSFRLEHLHLFSKALLQPSQHRTPGLQIKVKFTRFYRTTSRLRTSSLRLLLRLSNIPFDSPRRSLNLVWFCNLGYLSYCSFGNGLPPLPFSLGS